MEVNLYIGNLQFETTDQDLQNPFVSEGMVISAKVMDDRFTGRSRGLAFVEMSTPEEAEQATNAQHGPELGRRILVANETSPLEEKHRLSLALANP